MMRKLVILVLVVILSLTLSSVAFANRSGNLVFYGNSQMGSVSDGQHGYSWYHSDSDQGSIANNKIWRYAANYNRDYNRDYNREFNRVYSGNYNSDLERYYYVDANGVSHYFYLDPDRDYKVHEYKNSNGTTQFWFEDIGWK